MRHSVNGRLGAAAALLATGLLGAATAGEPPIPAASGRFRGEKTSLEIRGAYAFWWKSASPADEPEKVLRVAVGNGNIDPAYFDRFCDRLHAIDARFVDAEYKVVYLEFTPAGKYHGLSFYFGPGDGCGYCYDPDVQSAVRLSGGRLQGHVASKDPKRLFDVELDVPVPAKEWGKPLAGGGGDAGKVYAKYETALEARNIAAARAVIDERVSAFWQKMEKEGKLDRYLDYTWKEKHLEMKSPRVTGGFVNGDRAVVLVEGENRYAKVRGEALLKREGGGWRFSDELLRVD